MKNLFTLFVLSVIFLSFACNNSQGNDKDDKATTQTVELSKISKGDKIGELKVESINYKKNDSYLLKLKGGFNIEGKIEKSAMDGTLSIKVDKNVIPSKLQFETTSISTDYIEFRNENKVKESMNNQQWKLIQKGSPIPATVRVKDFYSMGKMQSEYVNTVEFVSLLDVG